MAEKKSKNILGVIVLVLSAVLTGGTFLILHGCAQGSDGTWMTCHWAGEAVKAVSFAILLLALLQLIIPGKGVKAGINIGIAADAVLAALIPGNLIEICMMKTMHCYAVMKPGVMALGAAIALFALINAIVLAIGSRKQTKEKIQAASDEAAANAEKRAAQVHAAQVSGSVLEEKDKMTETGKDRE